VGPDVGVINTVGVGVGIGDDVGIASIVCARQLKL